MPSPFWDVVSLAPGLEPHQEATDRYWPLRATSQSSALIQTIWRKNVEFKNWRDASTDSNSFAIYGMISDPLLSRCANQSRIHCDYPFIFPYTKSHIPISILLLWTHLLFESVAELPSCIDTKCAVRSMRFISKTRPP